MDDPHQSSPHTSEIKNILPDVVHSQQIPTIGSVTNETETGIEASENTEENLISQDVEDSKTESISEHIPSKIEYSTDSEHASRTQGLLKVDPEQEKASKHSSLNIPFPHSPSSENLSTQDPSKVSLSLPLDVNAVSDIHLLSEESPVNLVPLSDLSKETHEKSHISEERAPSSEHDTPNLTPRGDNYLDSLNDESSHKSDLSLQDSADNSDKIDSPGKVSSGSEEIIKLDIRGQAAPKFPFPSAKIIFGPPPEGGTVIDSNVEPIPVFPNLLSPFLVGAGDNIKVEEVFDDQEECKGPSPDKSQQLSPEKESLSSDKSIELSPEGQSLSTDNSLQMSPDKQSLSSDKVEADLLVEEITVEDELKEKVYDKPEETSMPKSMAPEETMSFSTLTDYKTICEEYHVKLVHLEDAITQRDELIEELTISLQRSVRERDDLRHENDHLTNEVQNLQHVIGERSQSEHDTVKAQLSDFMKYQSMIKDDSTKFYSAIMSGGSSIQSSNGEKDMDREEIVVNFSKSDLQSSDVSDEFQTGFENKLTTIIQKFDSYIEENLRNKLRESLIQVLCDEIGKMRIDNDTEIKELESQLQQDKQAYTIEMRRLRELLASVKAGNADIDALRQELDIKHEKEMENLRTYFEKKCSDMERSYSEEVWRDKACASPCGSAASLDAPTDAAGDCARRRTRSVQLASLSVESTQLEQSLRQVCKKYEQQIDELKAEHVAYVNELQATHREAIASLDEQITQLKAHIQTAENTETNVSLYQQDIDLELEKKMEAQLEQRLEEVRDEVRQEVVNHLQEQLQVLLSDPDAEVSSWPLELVALRDKIHGDAVKSQGEKECSSLRDELSVSEDKWKTRRNISFDQNRQLEEVTRERDDLKRVAVSLHRVVGQLVAYCASAEDELNRTVLAQLLARLIPENDTIIEEDSRPSTPNLSGELNQSLVSRSGKHVHFAPDLNAILTDLDEEGIVNFLQHQRDLSADIKKELENSLRRLRHEAHSLLDLSAKLAPRIRADTSNMLESSIQITELVHDLDAEQNCDNCELHRKNMEEAMAECLQRENLLRSDLEAAMIKIAQLMTSGEVIAEGYGTGPQLGSLGARARAAPGSAHSLDGSCSPRVLRLAHDIDSLQKERDDLHQQVGDDVTLYSYGTGPQLGSLGARARAAPGSAHSLDGSCSPRVLRLAHDIDSLQKERDDLHQQVGDDVTLYSYGTGPQLGSLGARARAAPGSAHSLDGSCSPRVLRLAHDIDSLQKERDDLHQQVGDDVTLYSYGTGPQLGSLGARARAAPGSAHSLDGSCSPRVLRLAHDIDSLQKERDDLHQQVGDDVTLYSYGTGPQLGSLGARARAAPGSAHSLDGSCSPRVLRLAHDIDSLQKERDDLHQQVGDDVTLYSYGTGPQLGSLGARARAAPGSAHSLDGSCSPRVLRLAHDIDSLQKERDDLHQQLEAANRQLRSTRQFVEEQASEREAERDEFARRLAELRDENTRLATRLQNNARILNEVEQLEAQTREMNQIITELETRKASTDDELKAAEEKITLLRDIIANLEIQLEQKTVHETEILEELEQMKNTIEERDSKMRTLVGELESLRSERVEQSDVVCVKCGQEEEKHTELLERVKEQCHYLEEMIHRRTRKMERIHEVCSTSCSEPSEDVSIRDQRHRNLEVKSPDTDTTPRSERMCELVGVWDCFETHARAEDAVLKRVADLEMQRAQLKDIAQEVRAERDVLQARMSEQALKISSLSARLQQQRNDAEALSHQATSQLSVQLHDALAEVQRLKEELDSKDKQLARVKQNLEEREKLHDEHHSLYGNSCNPKDKVIILERELSSAQSRIAQLESLARSLEKDKEELQITIRDHQRTLAEKENQLQELLELKLDEENQKEENGDVLEGKASARTLSDIVSISEFDEQDLQMRRAELKGQNVSLTGAPYADTTKEKTLNRTLPPELEKANMSSLHIEYIDHFDLPGYTPRADSLPAHLTSTQNKELLKQYKRNVNETTMFGGEMKHAQVIQDNCSMYPNRDVNDSKDLTVEPKKINFSLEATDNKTHNDYTSLGELGITVDVKQENFPDILTQLKHEIKKSRSELENCKSALKNAEEQLCEFPALKEEVEELKGLLENTMATMEHDKKFYENQLDNFSSNKKLLEQRLTELTQEVNDKSKDLHLLKEDILRRENMILELAKEKRNLTNKMTELEVKIDELQSRNNALEKYETENHQMREKVNELQKLQQLVSEKNQQIDSLNQHLDRLDDLQRCLNDKTEELDNLKEAFEEKSNELFHLQDTVEALNRDVAKLNEENDKLNTHHKDLKLKLTKLEKEQENASLKLQSNESELVRVNSLNTELTAKIDELKLLTDKLKDKETEIEILHEDINAFHEEIASLKEQLKMVSRSPSPRSKSGDERKSLDRQASSDKKQLVKIRKQISLLQHELDFNKKELNDKAFELAKAKLDVTELRNNISQANKQSADKDAENAELKQHADSLQHEIQQLMAEKDQLAQQLETVVARLREESNVGELKNKLRQKVERCQELEVELENLRELMDRVRLSPGREAPRGDTQRALAVRSPTAELERALRDQLDYSHTLDEDIMEQILSASSDEREDIPRLALNTSKSSSSIHSSSSDRINRLRSENDKLLMQVNNLEARLRDKDALITELNRVRDKLVQDWQTSKLRYEAERDNCGRLSLLLDTHKQTAESLQNQDSNMIQILKKRLEAAMQSELELQQREQQARARLAQLERQLLDSAQHNDPVKSQLHHEMENSERLKGEVSLLKSKLEVERTRYQDLQAMLDHSRLQAEREMNAKNEQCNALKNELAELKRLKHDAGVQLLRAKELISTQSYTISELEKKLSSSVNHKPVTDALTEIESTKTELARELATLKKCLVDTHSPELLALRADKLQLTAQLASLQSDARARSAQAQPDERDQAIRYLHGRCLRLESCRKALVWQKRYLQRVLAGYTELEKNLRLPSSRVPEVSKGKKRFKCIATVVVIVLRMGFLVRRRQHVRALSANCILRTSRTDNNLTRTTPTAPACGSSPAARGAAARPAAAASPAAARPAGDSLARRVLKHDMRLNLPASPGLGDFVRRSPYSANSPHDDPFILSSPRGEVAAAYLNKLELVSRCLNHAMDASRDVP